MCVYVLKKKKKKKKIILNKVHLKLTGTMEVTRAAASFSVNSTVKLAVEIQRHAVITNFF